MSARPVHAGVSTSKSAQQACSVRTTARCHLADALVEGVGHEHVAARIDGHASGMDKASAGPVPVGISPVGAIDPARKR